MNELCKVMIIDRMYYDLFRSKSSPLKKASHDAEIDWARRSVLLMSDFLYDEVVLLGILC